MSTPPAQDVTGLLLAWRDGDDAALQKLIPLVYAELRGIAHHHIRGERQGEPLQTTALVNEAYLRLVESARVRWHDRAHFFAIAARLMRRILVDAARSRDSLKRGGEVVHVPLEDGKVAAGKIDVDVIALDEALTRLAVFDARKSRVVELRYFAGLSVKETAEALDVSPQTVMRDWTTAKLWLLRELNREGPRRSTETQ